MIAAQTNCITEQAAAGLSRQGARPTNIAAEPQREAMTPEERDSASESLERTAMLAAYDALRPMFPAEEDWDTVEERAALRAIIAAASAIRAADAKPRASGVWLESVNVLCSAFAAHLIGIDIAGMEPHSMAGLQVKRFAHILRALDTLAMAESMLRDGADDSGPLLYCDSLAMRVLDHADQDEAQWRPQATQS